MKDIELVRVTVLYLCYFSLLANIHNRPTEKRILKKVLRHLGKVLAIQRESMDKHEYVRIVKLAQDAIELTNDDAIKNKWLSVKNPLGPYYLYYKFIDTYDTIRNIINLDIDVEDTFKEVYTNNHNYIATSRYFNKLNTYIEEVLNE